MSRVGVRTSARLLLTAASFVVYAGAVVALHQDRSVAFVNEEIGPITAALSRRLDNAPLGYLDTGLFEYFVQSEAANVPAKAAVDEARSGAVPRSGRLMIAHDGIGIGGMLVAELAFTLFGSHARALPLFYLLLIGLSTGLFVARYRDQRMSAAPTLLAALTLLLLTPLSDHPAITEAPLGGIRSYALVGILPALHWCFEFADRFTGRRGAGGLRWGLLLGQLPILALATLARGSPLYLVLPLLASIALTLWRQGRPALWRTAALLVVPAAALMIGVGATAELGYRDYVASGKAFVTIWHRAFLGLGVDPDWPYPKVREAYPCPRIPEGIVGISDRNGHCIWHAYAHAHHLSDDELVAKVYGSEYEAALRDAYFFVWRNYPRRVLVSYLYSKPLAIVATVREELSNLSPTATPVVWKLALAQLIIIIAFVAARPPPAPLRDAAWRVAILLPFLVAVTLPLIIAWAAPHTVLDLLAYLLCLYIVALWFVISGGIALFRLLFARPRSAG